MANKMTNKMALNYVLENCELPTEISEKLTAMVAALEKKNSGERKPTAKQNENAVVRAALVEFINENMSGDGFTCADLIAQCGAVANKSNQYVSAILRQAVLAGEISRGTVKRRTYFAPYGVYAEATEGEGE